MGRTVYLPYLPQKSTIHLGKDTVRPMDPMGLNNIFVRHQLDGINFGRRWRRTKRNETQRR